MNFRVSVLKVKQVLEKMDLFSHDKPRF